MPQNLPEDAALTFSQENPKRKGTKAATRYDLYRTARTVGEALQLGATRGDIDNDIGKGFCRKGPLAEGSADAAQVLDGSLAKVADDMPGTEGKASCAESANSVASPVRGKKRSQSKREAPLAAVVAGMEKVKQDDESHNKRQRGEKDGAKCSERPAAKEGPPSKPWHLDSADVPAALPHVVSPALATPSLAADGGAAALARLLGREPAVSEPAPKPAEACNQGPASASNSSACSSGAAKKKFADVDLSFANFDGKPHKFVTRVMAESRRLLSTQGLADAEKEGYKFSLEDRDRLSKWRVEIRSLNKDGRLAKDCQKLDLKPQIDLEISLPDGYPMEPPFARVVYPQLSGGFVFSRGGICFEPLTAKGWVPTMTLPSLTIAIIGILDYGDVRVSGVGNRETRTVPHYTEEGARKDHSSISSAHRGGDSNTYTSVKHLKS